MPRVQPMQRPMVQMRCPGCGRTRAVPRMHRDPPMAAAMEALCIACDPRREGEPRYFLASGQEIGDAAMSGPVSEGGAGLHETQIAPWVSDAPKGCTMPQTMPADDAALYQRLRTAHCAQRRASHECSGRITLDRNGMTLQCPLCGDARTVYPKTTGRDPHGREDRHRVV